MKHTLFFALTFCLLGFSGQSQNPITKQQKAALINQPTPSNISLAELLQKKDPSLIITSDHVSRTSNIHHYYVRQAIGGLEVYGTESSIHFDKTGKLITEHNRFLNDIDGTIKGNARSIHAEQAIRSVANQMRYKIQDLKLLQNVGGTNEASVYSKAGISSRDIPVKLMYYYHPEHGTQLVWELSVMERNSSNWYNFRVNAATGRIIDKDNWTLSCNILGDHSKHNHDASDSVSEFVGPLEESFFIANSAQHVSAPVAKYMVFPLPIESPNHGTRSMVTNPENLIASPYGWHDVDGNPGAEYTYTRGNNAEAYDDSYNLDSPNGHHAYSPGGNLIFDFPLSTTYSSSNRSIDAAITNLFYWTNIMHDISYQYGFDEASGNFQQNNYGKGGLGNDPVNAEAQDGSGTCNANFGTGPDGQRPRMQMYVCNSRDGDFDNLVILHEYGHGISVRLTGGANNAACLYNDEQMGEGWSDFFGLMLTMKPGDVGTDARGIGTWLFGEGPNGPGIRNYRYSTDFAINPHTYDDIKSGWSPHDLGEVWATMLWEMTWEIMATNPFDPDLYNGTGGNNVALSLVIEALKLQPCSPGFIDGRDAILAADQALYGGAHICAIWEAFARRGLGYSASQGSTNTRTDGTEAFDLPPHFSGIDVIEEVCLASGVQTNLSGGSPEGGIYSGPGVTDDGNGTTFTFDPSVAGEGMATISYSVTDFCTGVPTTVIDEILVTNNPPQLVCVGTGAIYIENSIYNTTPVSIPDNNSAGVTSTLQVTENVSISDLNVKVDINHGWVGDVIVKIKSPAGTTATIIDQPGRTNTGYGCSGSDILAILDDEADTMVENECAPTTPTINGRFIPNNPLSVFNGESTMGTWELTVIDASWIITGTLNSWGLEYTYEEQVPVLDVVLDSSGQAIINADQLLHDVSVDCGTYTVLGGADLTSTIAFNCTNVGLQNIPVQVTSQGNATAVCSALINVIDPIAPEITCPEDSIVTVNVDYELPDYFLSGEATATDNCSQPALITSQVPAPGTMLPTGDHIITLTAEDNSGNSSSCTFLLKVESTVGIGDISELGTVNLFPNPAKNSIQITNPKNLVLDEMGIYDLRGRLIKNFNLKNMNENFEFDVSELSSSVYFVIIKGKDGQTIKRMIKE